MLKPKSLARIVVVLLLLNISFAAVLAQNARDEKPPLRERLFFGGSLGLMFGTYTDIDISPIIGLWVLPRLNIAAGPEFRYLKYYDEKANIYGGRVYSQFVIIKDLNNMLPMGVHLGFFLHGEYEFFQYDYTNGFDSQSTFIDVPLLGGGISQPLGRRASLNIMVLWALNDYYGIYSQPEFRISFTF